MKKVLLLLALASICFYTPAYSQCNEDPNEIGIFWSQDCTACENCISYVGGAVTAYVVLANCTQPGGISGFEFELVNADGSLFGPPLGSAIFVSSYTIPPYAINVDSPPVFVVGLGAPMPWSPCMVLLSIEILVFTPEPWCFGVKPTPYPSIPGQMAYAGGADPGLLIPMMPNNGLDAPDYAMACLNSPDCPLIPVATDGVSWGSIKSLYR
jgi:hypothetical protein